MGRRGALAARRRFPRPPAHNERLFSPKRGELSPRRVDADAVGLLDMLCPEAADYLYDGGALPLDAFLAEHPAPADVRL